MKQVEKKENRRRLVLLLGVLAAVVSLGIMLPEKSKGGAVQEMGQSVTLNEIAFIPYLSDTPPLTEKPYALLEFFTTDCRFCKASVGELNALNRNEKLNVIAYTYEGKKKVRGFIEAYGAEYPISRATQQFRNHFDHTGVPASYLVDSKTLEVKAKFIGKVSSDEVLSYIK